MNKKKKIQQTTKKIVEEYIQQLSQKGKPLSLIFNKTTRNIVKTEGRKEKQITWWSDDIFVLLCLVHLHKNAWEIIIAPTRKEKKKAWPTGKL